MSTPQDQDTAPTDAKRIAEARKVAESGAFRDMLYLVRQGIPYDVVSGMTEEHRLAHLVAFGELDGGSFDWDKMEWRKD